jgi:hypothetical protein
MITSMLYLAVGNVVEYDGASVSSFKLPSHSSRVPLFLRTPQADSKEEVNPHPGRIRMATRV